MTSDRTPLACTHRTSIGLSRSAALLAAALAATSALAADQAPPETPPTNPFRLLNSVRPAVHRVADAPQQSTLYDTGEIVTTPWELVWRPMCGTDPMTITQEELTRIADNHEAEFAAADPDDVIIVDGGIAGAGINIIYSLGGSVPPAAIPAFAAAEAYIEAQFSDPITVTVTVTFQNMSPGVLGGTGSYYTYSTWTTARNGLINGQDADDTIQDFLPTGSTIPVRYNGNTSTVTNEGYVYWTRANYRATIGTVFGNAATMTYNTAFTWDFDPSNGINSGTYSFQDVVIHETGHALGFTSGGDFRVNDIEALDIYRFQYTDGTGDYNPDTTAEFQIRARLVDYNTPNDAHNSDIISVEYRMSDGSPYQMSHFREQFPNIGIMDPAIGYGQTFYPNFLKTSDLTMFDAIGYDR